MQERQLITNRDLLTEIARKSMSMTASSRQLIDKICELFSEELIAALNYYHSKIKKALFRLSKDMFVSLGYRLSNLPS